MSKVEMQPELQHLVLLQRRKLHCDLRTLPEHCSQGPLSDKGPLVPVNPQSRWQAYVMPQEVATKIKTEKPNKGNRRGGNGKTQK